MNVQQYDVAMASSINLVSDSEEETAPVNLISESNVQQNSNNDGSSSSSSSSSYCEDSDADGLESVADMKSPGSVIDLVSQSDGDDDEKEEKVYEHPSESMNLVSDSEEEEEEEEGIYRPLHVPQQKTIEPADEFISLAKSDDETAKGGDTRYLFVCVFLAF